MFDVLTKFLTVGSARQDKNGKYWIIERSNGTFHEGYKFYVVSLCTDEYDGPFESLEAAYACLKEFSA